MATLAELGERKAIEVLRRVLDHALPADLEDDCAIIPWGDDFLLAATDVVNEDTHLPPGATPFQIGWYVVASNLSDIAAMGGDPLGCLVALTLPRTTTSGFLEELARGMDACAREFGIAILGGDTKEGPRMSIAGTALGKVSKSKILLRRGGNQGEYVVVTGDLGRGGWAMRALEREELRGEALETLLRPYPRIEEGKHLSECGSVTSCMDLSDGLANTLYQLREVNGLSYSVDASTLPLFGRMREVPLSDPLDLALYHGGDYELLFTLKPGAYEDLRAMMAKEHLRITKIGEVVSGEGNVLIRGSRTEPLENKGWEHFR